MGLTHTLIHIFIKLPITYFIELLLVTIQNQNN